MPTHTHLGPGDDVHDAGGGRDVVHGEDGNDVIDGGANRDLVSGDAGNDVLNGGGSNDVVGGDGGDDIVFGGQGEDRVIGGDGADWVIGGNDDDIMYLATTNNDTLGDGHGDTVFFDETDGTDKVYGFETGLDKVVLDGVSSYSLTNDGVSSYLTFGTTTVTFYNEILTNSDITYGTVPVFGDYL